MEAFLRKTYYDIKNPAGFSSVQKLRQAAIDAGYRASHGQVRKFLRSQETYAISKEARTHFPRNHVTPSGLNHQWDCDLCDFVNIADENDGYCYFLIILDQFSRKVYAVKLKSKRPSDVIGAFKIIFDQGVKPKYSLYSDKGAEFTAGVTKQFFNDMGIKQFFSANETKASSVERALKTIKQKMFKYFLEKQHHRWVDILQDTVSSYNNSLHSSLGMTPNEVNSENEELVRYNQAIIRQKSNGVFKKVEKAKSAIKNSSMKSEDNLATKNDNSKQKKSVKTSRHSVMLHTLPSKRRSKFKPGDLVRISRIKDIYKRAYSHQYTAEIFQVEKIAMRDGIPVYNLISYELRDHIKGSFYEEELLRAYPRKSKSYKIGDILKTRGAGRAKEAYVSWFLHPKSYNSWVPYKSVKDLPKTKERKLIEKSKKTFHKQRHTTAISINKTSDIQLKQQSKHTVASALHQSSASVQHTPTNTSKKSYQHTEAPARQQRQTVSRDIPQQTRFSARLRAKKTDKK